MMAYAEGFAGPNVVGVILSVTAAIGAALYKVNSEKYWQGFDHRDAHCAKVQNECQGYPSAENLVTTTTTSFITKLKSLTLFTHMMY